MCDDSDHSVHQGEEVRQKVASERGQLSILLEPAQGPNCSAPRFAAAGVTAAGVTQQRGLCVQAISSVGALGAIVCAVHL